VDLDETGEACDFAALQFVNRRVLIRHVLITNERGATFPMLRIAVYGLWLVAFGLVVQALGLWIDG
jgi:hypothetical protein